MRSRRWRGWWVGLALAACPASAAATPPDSTTATISANGAIYALARSDHGTLYVGGHFSQIGGKSRIGLAEVDLRTGMVTGWNPNLVQNDPNTHTDSCRYVGVNALLVVSGAVYAGGCFNSVNGIARSGGA